MKLHPVVILTGPTAVGKTQLSLKLAKRIQGEIVSADSMQVYQYMDIGTAKIHKEGMQGIPHHMIDILKPWEDFNVVTFQKMARKSLEKIYENGHIPIVAGGTGFYIQALLKNIDFTENEEDISYRKYLEQLANDKGNAYLHDMLRQVDDLSAQAIHCNNVKRVIRALEFYKMTGLPISAHNEKEKERESAYNSCYFVLNDHREHLYQNIDMRVEEMIKQGLVEEVKRLSEMGCHRSMISMQGLGYKEILSYLEGEISLEEAVYFIKRDTRHFAKRQLTWFRREKEVIWINKWEYDYDDERILDFITETMKEKHMF